MSTKRWCPRVRPGPFETGAQLRIVAAAMAGRALALAAQKVDSPAKGPPQSSEPPPKSEGPQMPGTPPKPSPAASPAPGAKPSASGPPAGGPPSPPALWYPEAHRVSPELPTIGAYAKGYPLGAVVHYTAGAYGLSELDLARQRGYAYFLIDEHGGVHQGFPLNRWGSHAGESTWPGLGDHVSHHLVGIEVDCAGLLKSDGHGVFHTAWGVPIPAAEARVVPVKTANQTPGAYHRYTAAQESALRDLLLWLKTNNPAVFDLQLVLGHDEVSPGRKQDPGGALAVTMPELRRQLEERYRLVAGGGARSA